ncbi:MAG: hypothetical protein ACOCXM_03490 [Myxococcota bacterium]
MRKRTMGVALIVLFSAAVAVAGCSDRELKPLNPCVLSNVVIELGSDRVNEVDLLFVVDSSVSMLEEQQALAEEFPALINTLASGNQTDGDGIPNFDPVDLHVGVVTTDLGIGNAGLGTCTELGDEAIMIDSSSAPGCDALSLSPKFLEFRPDDEITDFEDDFGCLVEEVGAEGCFSEQQLEAALKALTPSDSEEVDFAFNEAGQGNPDGANAGFVTERSDALLAVVIVSDEDDCSYADQDLWLEGADQEEREALPYPGQPNPRCALPRNADALHPVQRYVDGLIGIKDDPERVVFAVIGGIPPDITDTQDFDGMLAREELHIKVADPTVYNTSTDRTVYDYDSPEAPPADPWDEDTDTPLIPTADPDGIGGDTEDDYDNIYDYPQIHPSCIRGFTHPDGEAAFANAHPPVRLVKTAKALNEAGAQSLVTSICKEGENPEDVDFSDALNDILEAIASQLTGACLPRKLNPRPDGLVDCRVLEVQPPGSESCDESLGRFPPNEDEETRDEEDRLLCEVEQVLVEGGVEPTEPGWFYDTEFNVEDCPPGDEQRITFTEGAEPRGPVRLECLQSVTGSEGEQATVGSPCVAGETNACESDQFGDELECNPETNTCMVNCTVGGEYLDSECANAGLRGFVCDPRDTDQEGLAVPTQGFCVDPVCVP